MSSSSAHSRPDPIILWPGTPHEMVFCFIPAGRFRMGNRGGEYADEEPRHWVEITRPFWMAETPVTQAQYRYMAGQCLAALQEIEDNKGPEPSDFKGKDSHPVENVNWHEAQVTGKWLTESGLLEAGLRADLPTEAQWEYACRAGTQMEYHTGDGEAALAEAGWFDGNAGSSTHPVKEKARNDFALYDMHGNVWEWCADEWDASAYSKRPDGVSDPFLEAGGSDPPRVVRGGSWVCSAADCRSAYRLRRRPGDRNWLRGFRLCLSSGPVENSQAKADKHERSRNLESQARDEPETEGGGGADWTAGATLPSAPKDSA